MNAMSGENRYRIGQRSGHADDGVQEDERRTAGRICRSKKSADLLLHGRQDLPVEEVHRVDAQQNAEREYEARRGLHRASCQLCSACTARVIRFLP
jgi:hypothetical protein